MFYKHAITLIGEWYNTFDIKRHNKPNKSSLINYKGYFLLIF